MTQQDLDWFFRGVLLVGTATIIIAGHLKVVWVKAITLARLVAFPESPHLCLVWIPLLTLGDDLLTVGDDLLTLGDARLTVGDARLTVGDQL